MSNGNDDRETKGEKRKKKRKGERRGGDRDGHPTFFTWIDAFVEFYTT